MVIPLANCRSFSTRSSRSRLNNNNYQKYIFPCSFSFLLKVKKKHCNNNYHSFTMSNTYVRAKLFTEDEIENSIQSQKQGHKCCGGCCDMRRAVIIVNIIALGGRLHGNWV
jgi:hypothetical protein